ncbi:PREDICTED: signal peptidase complex subunit 1 isoform X2 [Colobus angolensis palliatus]|uniref:signal peptidase complex subunit 1 isoform X2 n=1 Tax=Colobus angolensis palliatus TaxID=336983 RepID=UPI0005F3D838|nr:PREDICTED: signal peptidase complex subunit 1 isoform X2 [Colobus angolensis palliatus]
MARGGDMGCIGPSETSASGAAAIALPGVEGPPGNAQCQTLALRVHKSRSSSPRSLPPAVGCPPPQPAMLEHLSSLPTQMVRAQPRGPLHAAPVPGGFEAHVGAPTQCCAVPGPDGYPPHSLPNCLLGPLLFYSARICPFSLRVFQFLPGSPEFNFLPRSLGERETLILGLPCAKVVRSGQKLLSLRRWIQFFFSSASPQDYKGQKLAEQMFQGIILFSAVNSWIYLRIRGRTVRVDCLYSYGRICFFMFADASSMAHLSPASSQVVTCSRLKHRRQETRGKKN